MLNYKRVPDPPPGVEGRWQCRLPVVLGSSPCTGASCTLLRAPHSTQMSSVSFNAQPLWEQALLVVVCLLTLSPGGSDNTCRSSGTVSAHVTGGRTGGIVGMLGPGS